MYCAVPISFTQAVLGANITIEALDGKKIAIKVPDGTANGKMLRIKGEGVPVTGSSRKGDLYVKIVVRTPVSVSGQQKELLKKYMELEKPKSEPELLPLASLGR